MEKTSKQRQLVEIHQVLTNRFDDAELRTLCFHLKHLGLEYDDLLGEGKSNKARELVAFFDRREQIPELVQAIKNLRPDIEWNISVATFTNEIHSKNENDKPENENDKPEQSEWHWALLTSSIFTLALSVIWFAVERSFEPLIGLFAGIGGVIVYKRHISKRVDLVISSVLVILFFSGIAIIFNNNFSRDSYQDTRIEVERLPNGTQIEVTWKNLPLEDNAYSNHRFYLMEAEGEWFHRQSSIRQKNGSATLPLDDGISKVVIIAVPENETMPSKVNTENTTMEIKIIAQTETTD